MKNVFTSFGGAAKSVTLLLSLFFYSWWSPWFVFLLAFSAALDYVVGHRLHRAESPRKRRMWLIVSLVSNLGLDRIQILLQGIRDCDNLLRPLLPR